MKAMVDELNEARALAAGLGRDIGLARVVRGPGALDELGEVLAGCGVSPADTVVVLGDATPKRSSSGDVMTRVRTALSAYRVERVEVASDATENVHLDEATVTTTGARVAAWTPRALVTVGSGTMVDLGKVAAAALGVVHVVVPTAASVNGFSDDQSVLLVRGAKRTTPSRWPDVVLVDPVVLAGAPIEMTRSGLGDELSTFPAAADWYLAGAVGFETSFSRDVVDFMRRHLGSLLERAGELGHGDGVALETLAACLVDGGVAMGLAGRTAPSSGTEHVISHLLEMEAGSRHRDAASHGSTVGVATLVALRAWQRVRDRLTRGGATVCAPDQEIHERVLRAFGPLDQSGATAAECWDAYQRKARWIADNLANLQRVVDEWPRHDEAVSGLLAPVEAVHEALTRAGAPTDFASLDPAPEPEVVRWAVAHCHLMRDRFTVVDLAEALGAWGATDVEAVLETMSGGVR